VRNPFRRTRGLIVGNGFILGDGRTRRTDKAGLLALGDELNATQDEAERRDIQLRIVARMEEIDR